MIPRALRLSSSGEFGQEDDGSSLEPAAATVSSSRARVVTTAFVNEATS